MRIGFIGVGVMGSRMVKQLLGAGYDVTVFNRSIEKTVPLTKLGASVAKDIPMLVKESDVICTCLSMPEDVVDVYLSPNGIVDNLQANTICIDFTTVGAKTSKKVAKVIEEKGNSYLDAPVSGGPEGAEDGTLTIMVGGEKKVYNQVQPILSILGKTIEYLGGSGSGSIAKLINQYLVAVHSVAASEAMVTGAAHGLDSEKLYQLLKVSYADSRMLQRHMDSYVLDRQFEPGGAVKYVHKDVKLANHLVREAGVSKSMGEFAEQSFQKAIDQGFANLDMSAVIQPLEKECKVEVKRLK